MRNADHPWKNPPGALKLEGNEVHVWKISLDMLTHELERLRPMLADEEIERAGRFYFEKDSQHWTVAHAVLRMVLGRYLETDPHALRFTTNTHGKPSIVQPFAGTHLHFNISHSGAVALYAFATDREVGVDVEYRRTGIEYSELATSFFSAREYAAFHALPASLQEEAFFLGWTRKEAYIKARGKGLALPLDQFDVSLDPGKPAALLDSREDPHATQHWSLQALAPGEHYAGAVVAEGTDWRLCCWQWPPR